VRTIDLIKVLDHAELRPSSASFQLAEHTFAGQPRASIVVPVPSRITWPTAIPRRATLGLDAAAVPRGGGVAAVRVRIGISDDRVYEALAERTILTDTAAWTPIAVDLSPYAGRKFSLFYQPDGRTWRLVLAADVAEGAADLYWGNPGIDTDAAAARDFTRSRAQTRR
jgi:hypothetical protein